MVPFCRNEYKHSNNTDSFKALAEFWKILNDTHNKRDVKARFDDLVNHFKELNHTATPYKDLNSPPTSNNVFNEDFTLDEINSTINKIKTRTVLFVSLEGHVLC